MNNETNIHEKKLKDLTMNANTVSNFDELNNPKLVTDSRKAHDQFVSHGDIILGRDADLTGKNYGLHTDTSRAEKGLVLPNNTVDNNWLADETEEFKQ